MVHILLVRLFYFGYEINNFQIEQIKYCFSDIEKYCNKYLMSAKISPPWWLPTCSFLIHFLLVISYLFLIDDNNLCFLLNSLIKFLKSTAKITLTSCMPDNWEKLAYLWYTGQTGLFRGFILICPFPCSDDDLRALDSRRHLRTRSMVW